jgi:LmbE family N-acetylglucosaminyl deacetylase
VLILMNYADRWGFGPLNMSDHRAVGVAALDAARDAGNRWVFPELLADGLEPWGGVRWAAVGAAPVCTHGVDVTTTIDAGIASLAEHRAYLAGLGDGATDPDAFLRENAARSGEQLGVRYAAAFELVLL